MYACLNLNQCAVLYMPIPWPFYTSFRCFSMLESTTLAHSRVRRNSNLLSSLREMTEDLGIVGIRKENRSVIIFKFHYKKSYKISTINQYVLIFSTNTVFESINA